MTVPSIQDLIDKSFDTEVLRPAGDVRKLFHREQGDWSSDRIRIQEMDRERFAEVKTEGQASAQRGISQGYNKEIVRKTISVERLISGEAYKALTAHKLAQYATQVGADVIDKIELDMKNWLGMSGSTSYTDNGGFSVDLTVGDGLAPFSASHTLKNVATTYSNLLTGAPSLSEDSIETAEDFFAYSVLDNNGQPIKMKPNTLITSNKAQMKNRVKRLLSSLSPATINLADNDNSNVANVNRDKFQHLAIDFVCDANGVADTTLSFNWFLACLGGMPETSLQAYYVSWMSPETAPVEVNQSEWTLSWVARAAYGIGAVSGKGIVKSAATF